MNITRLITARHESANSMLKKASYGKRIKGVTSQLLDDVWSLGSRRKSYSRGGGGGPFGHQLYEGVPTSAHVNLADEIDAAHDLGLAASQTRGLTGRADINKASIKKSYSDLFNPQSESNPFQLLRQAKSKVYNDLGDEFIHKGSNLKDVTGNEMEQLIIKSLGKRADEPIVREYAEHLIKSNTHSGSDLKVLSKKMLDDFAEGIEPKINIPSQSGNRGSLSIVVDKPMATFHGSPVFDLKKTFGIKDIDDLNGQYRQMHDKAETLYSNLQNAKHLKPREQQKIQMEFQRAHEEVERTGEFMKRMGQKIQNASASGGVNAAKFTLDDIKSYDDALVFFGNPLATKGVTSLQPAKVEMLSSELLQHIRQQTALKGNSPQVVKSAIISKLDNFAKDPSKAGFLDTFHFARYTTDEMKDIVGTLRGTKGSVMNEALRLGSDAAFAVGGVGLAGLGIKTMLDKSRNKARIEPHYK